jgi:hypothetical protein
VFEDMLDEHLRLGDSRAACVTSIEPFLVAAYTDELDCVAVLGFPAWLVEEHNLKVGGRLLTVNTYRRGQRIMSDLMAGSRQLGRYVNFYPVIAEFVSDDVQRIAARKAEIVEEEWLRCERMGIESLQRFPNRWRNGSPFWSDQPVPLPSATQETRPMARAMVQCPDCKSPVMVIIGQVERCLACGSEVRALEVGKNVEDEGLKRLLSSEKVVERVGASPGGTGPSVSLPKKRPWWKFWG